MAWVEGSPGMGKGGGGNSTEIPVPQPAVGVQLLSVKDEKWLKRFRTIRDRGCDSNKRRPWVPVNRFFSFLAGRIKWLKLGEWFPIWSIRLAILRWAIRIITFCFGFLLIKNKWRESLSFDIYQKIYLPIRPNGINIITKIVFWFFTNFQSLPAIKLK